MVLQVGTDGRAIVHHLDPVLAQMIRRADPRQHQKSAAN